MFLLQSSTLGIRQWSRSVDYHLNSSRVASGTPIGSNRKGDTAFYLKKKRKSFNYPEN